MNVLKMVGLAVVACSALASAPAAANTRRFAIVVGHNTGGPSRAPLRYAESDAGKMARVFSELADVAPGDVLLLQGRRLADVERAALELRDRVRETHASLGRAVVYFYYSGHGDTDALELGSERLSHERLREMLAGTNADLRLAFIDACRSGAAVQEKGARGAPAFNVQLMDELKTRGHAVITSSARDEVALESTEMGGGFFTNHLVTGMRGAADVSGDGQVTLAELYRYAHDRTVSTTAETTGTAQHPSYDLNLSGQGELVLARLERATAKLRVPSEAERALLRDVVSDQLIAEWVGGGAASAIAVPPGVYSVTLVADGKSYGGRVRVDAGEERVLRLEELRTVQPLVAAVQQRGLPQPDVAPPAGRKERLEVGLLAGLGRGTGGMARLGIEARSGHGITAGIMVGMHTDRDWFLDKPFDAHTYSLVARGGYRFLWTYEGFGAWVGLEVGGGFTLTTDLPFAPGGRSIGTVMVVGPRAGFFYEPNPHLRIGVTGDALFWGYPAGHMGLGFSTTWAL